MQFISLFKTLLFTRMIIGGMAFKERKAGEKKGHISRSLGSLFVLVMLHITALRNHAILAKREFC